MGNYTILRDPTHTWLAVGYAHGRWIRVHHDLRQVTTCSGSGRDFEKWQPAPDALTDEQVAALLRMILALD